MGWTVTRRLALVGACLWLLTAVNACSGAGTADDIEPASPASVAATDDDAAPGELGNPTADRRGPLPDGGAIRCVESYAPAAVSERGFAFDGVVADVGPPVSDRGDEADLGLPGVTFEVREWFSGGRGDTVTVDMQLPTTGSDDPSDPEYAYGVGSQLLVSGEPRWGGSPLESPIAWGCGFSRYYDPGTATAWRNALAR